MPLYSYWCQQCQQDLQVFVQSSTLEPKRCGHRCLLPASTPPEDRGCGELKRKIKAIQGQIKSSTLRDKPTIEEAGKAGFTILKNEGDGKVRQIAGPPLLQQRQVK